MRLKTLASALLLSVTLAVPALAQPSPAPHGPTLFRVYPAKRQPELERSYLWLTDARHALSTEVTDSAPRRPQSIAAVEQALNAVRAELAEDGYKF